MLTTIRRIPVHVQPTFWLLAFFIAWLNGGDNLIEIIIWVSIIPISILFHEYGHALTAVAFQQRAAIDLVIYGGVTRRTGKKLKRWQDFLIVLNGPLAGILLCAITYGILQALNTHLNAISIYALTVTWKINLFWTILNLLPVFPLDGGQLLTISMQGFFGLKGLRAALLLSTLISLTVGILFFAIQAILPGAIFIMLTFESFRNWRSACAMTTSDENPAIQHQMHLAETFIKEGNVEQAEKVLEQLTLTTQEGIIHSAAVMALAKLYYQQGRHQSVLSLLKPIADKLDGPGLEIMIQSALHANDLDTILSYGNRAYQEFPSVSTALANARTHARLGNITPSIGWLQCAIRDGLPDPATILSLPDFDTIRTSDNWKNFATNLFKK